MTRPKASDPEALLDDADREDSSRGPTRKQIQDMLKRKESMVEVDLRGCDVSGLSFDGVDLSYAKLGEANCQKATFRRARLVGTSFWNANVREASFEESDLEDADFDYANLDGATFRGAKIRKAIFPLKRVPLTAIKASVRTGERIRMEAAPQEEED